MVAGAWEVSRMTHLCQTPEVKSKDYAQRTTLGPYCEWYLDWKRDDEGCAVKTIENYRYPLARMALELDKTPPAVTLSDLRNVRRGFPPRSSSFVTAVFRDFWNWMVDEGEDAEDGDYPEWASWPMRSPARRLRAPKKSKAIRTRIFSDPEVAALEALPLRDGALMQLLFDSGLRKAEACALKLMDVDLPGRHLTVVRGKGDKGRIVPLPEDTCRRLAELALLEGLDPTDHLWYSYRSGSRDKVPQRGEPITSWRFDRWWYDSLEVAGVSYKKRTKDDDGYGNPHQARHTFASRALKRGVRLTPLSKIMGHEKESTTADLYAHFDTADLVAEIDRAENEQGRSPLSPANEVVS